MTPGARLATAIEILDAVLAGEPAGLSLTRWSRGARYAGSRDRAAVRDIVYDCLRQKRSLCARAGAETGRAMGLAHTVAAGADVSMLFSGDGYAPAPASADELAALAGDATWPDPVRLDYPDFLDAELRRSLGAAFEPVMEAMRHRAPVDLRVNLAKASREDAAAKLRGDGIETEPLAQVATALRVVENARAVSRSAAYQGGVVELQDASSQAVAAFAQAAPGMRILDYCAGGGGKALALYDAIGGDGQIVAHDVAPVRMNDLPARAARAGARITVAVPGDRVLQAGAFDLVFVDAPCSGSGSWRRTPDAKWNLRPSDLDKLDTVQAEILRRAAGFVRPGGTLVYATCSMLARENQDRVATFLAGTDQFSNEGDLRLTPCDIGDGFYAIKLKLRQD